MVTPVKNQSVLQWQTFPLEKGNTDTEVNTSSYMFCLIFWCKSVWEDLCWLGYYLHYTCGTVGTASRNRDTVSAVCFPASNPSGTVKTEKLLVLELVPPRDLDPQKCLVLPREGGWMKYLNVCPVINCSILNSWCLDKWWCLCGLRSEAGAGQCNSICTRGCWQERGGKGVIPCRSSSSWALVVEESSQVKQPQGGEYSVWWKRLHFLLTHK